MSYLCEKTFNLLAGNGEVLIYHFLEVGPLFSSRVQILANNQADLFKSEHIMSALILLVVTDTALDLTNSGSIGTGEAAAELHHSAAVDMAKRLLIFGVA